MDSYSETSMARLNTCHPDIVTIMMEVIKHYDCSILEGLRTTEKQQEYFNATPPRTTLDGIIKKSKHQDDGTGLSRAIDIVPYKKGKKIFSGKEKDNRRFYFLMGMIRAISIKLLEEGKITHKVRFGLDWDSDDVFDDQNFDDMPHFELV